MANKAVNTYESKSVNRPGVHAKQNIQTKSLLPYTKKNTEGRGANLIKSWENQKTK